MMAKLNLISKVKHMFDMVILFYLLINQAMELYFLKMEIVIKVGLKMAYIQDLGI